MAINTAIELKLFVPTVAILIKIMKSIQNENNTVLHQCIAISLTSE